MAQLRQGVAALLGCPEAGPQVPLSPGWEQRGQSSAQPFRADSGLCYLLLSPGRYLSAASTPGTAPCPALLAQPHSVGRRALLAQLFVRCP